MKNKKLTLVVVCLLFTFFIGCSNTTKTQNSTTPNTSNAVTVKSKLTAQSVLNKLKETESSFITKELILTVANDKDNLIGRPNQYTEKITWNDNRAQHSKTVSSIEVFKTTKNATTRKIYLEKAMKSSPSLIQYIEQKNNMLLRIEGNLKPVEAAGYTKAFKLMKK